MQTQKILAAAVGAINMNPRPINSLQTNCHLIIYPHRHRDENRRLAGKIYYERENIE